MRHLISFCILIGVGISVANCQVLKQNKTSVLESSSLHWYGLDFSNTIICDPTEEGNRVQVKKNFFIEWQAYFNKHVSDGKILRWFRKDKLIDHRKKFYASHESLDVETLFRSVWSGSTADDKHVREVMQEMGQEPASSNKVKYQTTELSLAHLDSCIKSYDLEETEGLGAIMIVEKMSKAEKGTFVVGVLFDIATREVLVAIRDKGGWDSYGFVAVYGSGINDAVSRIGDKYRRRVLRN